MSVASSPRLVTGRSLEEDGVLTDCSIQTAADDEPLDLDIHATEIPCNIIMKVSLRVSVYVVQRVQGDRRDG